MPCMFGVDSANRQQQSMSGCYYSSTADLLDILPYSIEEAAQHSLLDFSLSVIEALQSTLNDSHGDFSFASSQAQKSVPIGSSNDFYINLHLPLTMPYNSSSASLCKMQLRDISNDAMIGLPSEKLLFQSEPYIDEGNVSALPSNDRPQSHLYMGEVQVHDFESWPTSSQQHHPCVEVSSGFVVRLRGYEETVKACKNGGKFITTTKCCCCQAILQCLEDAEFVLCQSCRFISPVRPSQRDCCSPSNTSPDATDAFEVGGGLAVGLTTSPEFNKRNHQHDLIPISYHMKHTIDASGDGLQPRWKKVKHVA